MLTELLIVWVGKMVVDVYCGYVYQNAHGAFDSSRRKSLARQ